MQLLPIQHRPSSLLSELRIKARCERPKHPQCLPMPAKCSFWYTVDSKRTSYRSAYFLVVKSVSREEEPVFSPRLQVHESVEILLDDIQRWVRGYLLTLCALSAGASAGGELVLGGSLVASYIVC